MAVREFRDESGRWWKAWDIKPEEIHPVTRGEDYLADCYVTGWIVFETFTGTEKRRLCPWPIRWTQESEDGLRKLLARAEPVPPYKLQEERQLTNQAPGAGHELDVTPGHHVAPDVTDLEVVRTFRYPGGRIWTVCVVPSHASPTGRAVLRFTAGARHIDLDRWPKAWADEPNDGLSQLLRTGAPREPASLPNPDAPRRRWNDFASPSA